MRTSMLFTTTLLACTMASTAPAASPAVSTLIATQASRHTLRWRELAHFTPAATPPASKSLLVVTLTDEHMGDDGLLVKNIVSKIVKNQYVVGISLRNSGISDDGIRQLAPLAGRLQLLDLYGTRITDAAMPTIGSFDHLIELDLGVTRVTATGLQEINRLKQLSVLELSGRRITDAAMVSLGVHPGLRHLTLSGTRVTDKGLASLGSLKRLTALSVAGTRIEGATLGSLTTIKSLVVLDLADTDVTGESIVQLQSLEDLQGLNLENCPLIVDATATHLASLTSLRGLVLTKTGFEKVSITGAGLVALSRLTRLEHLNLSATRINDASLAPLASLRQLRSLNLGLTAISNAGLIHLAKLEKLHSLSVIYQVGFGGTKVNADGLAHFAKHRSLRHLDMTGTRISDTDIDKLSVIPQLSTLTVSGTAITAEGASKLRKALPKCRVVH